MLRHVLHDERVAQIRLVGAVFLHGVGVGDARPRARRHALAIAEFTEDAADDRLDGCKNVFLLDEAHFEIELVEFARQTVGARILVAEARRDLEVAVEARHHDQLLVLLRRLRQRVEFSGMDARRHQEVARAFRARGRENRGLEFKEALPLHARAHAVDHLAAQHDVLVQPLAAQVEEAILQARLFGIVDVAEHRQRQFGRRTEHLDVADIDLDLAGRHVGVFGAGRALAHVAVDLDDPFGPQLLGGREGRGIGIDHALRDPVMVAQVDEEDAAMVADAVAPAGKPNLAAGIGLADPVHRCASGNDASCLSGD